jgi:hypothetical protein
MALFRQSVVVRIRQSSTWALCSARSWTERIIRQVGMTWIAVVADVRIDGDFATREDAWRAVDRFWTERHERDRIEEWKRIQGGR